MPVVRRLEKTFDVKVLYALAVSSGQGKDNDEQLEAANKSLREAVVTIAEDLFYNAFTTCAEKVKLRTRVTAPLIF